MLLEHDTRYGLKLQRDAVVRRNLGLPARQVATKRKPGNFQKRWTDDEIRDSIRRVANALGKAKITRAEYNRFVAQCDGDLFPSHMTVRRCNDEFVTK